jgi:hypothetical protein
MSRVTGHDRDWLHVQRSLVEPAECVTLISRNSPKTRSGDVSNVSQATTIHRAYCVSRKDHHRLLEIVGCEGIANPEQAQNKRFQGLYTYYRRFMSAFDILKPMNWMNPVPNTGQTRSA